MSGVSRRGKRWTAAYEAIGLGGLSEADYDVSTDEKADALAKKITRAYRDESTEAFQRLGAARGVIRESDPKLKCRLGFGSSSSRTGRV